MTPVPASHANEFAEAGVVFLPGALSAQTLALAREAWEWSINHPGPGAAELPAAGTGRFYQDLQNPRSFPAYDALLHAPEIGDIIAGLFRKPDVWFMYEQVFEKSGGTTRRTPWHQDSPYLPVAGADLAVMWIAFDPVPLNHALEFVRGSHRGTLYDGSRFDPVDDTAPIYGDGTLPRLPDIEADREGWPIRRWATAPGDIIVFHPATLHGGAATTPDFERRTLSLRFFGDDAVVAKRPGRGPKPGADLSGPDVHPLQRMRAATPGSPFRDPAFPRLR